LESVKVEGRRLFKVYFSEDPAQRFYDRLQYARVRVTRTEGDVVFGLEDLMALRRAVDHWAVEGRWKVVMTVWFATVGELGEVFIMNTARGEVAEMISTGSGVGSLPFGSVLELPSNGHSDRQFFLAE
jgi:hypothetical protein